MLSSMDSRLHGFGYYTTTAPRTKEMNQRSFKLPVQVSRKHSAFSLDILRQSRGPVRFNQQTPNDTNKLPQNY